MRPTPAPSIISDPNAATTTTNVTGPALVGIIIVAIGAAVAALLFVAFRTCMSHTHAVAKERVKSFSKSIERINSRGSGDLSRYGYEDVDHRDDGDGDDDDDDEEKQERRTTGH